MNLRQYLRRTALTVGGALGLLLVASALIIAFGITISLDPWRGRIESGATEALGRQVSITGPMTLSPALWPTLEVQGLRIANPPRTGVGGTFSRSVWRAASWG